MWAHDHRFFFTAENVYKGNLMMVNVYSGRDRGNEALNDGINLRLPSGSGLDFGNSDFDVNLIVSDGATDPDGQYFFDIFTTDGFIGDIPLVNFAYAPYFEVLPRKYRFRILNACMSRFIQLALADSSGKAVPFQFIANDGNLVVNPITLTQLDEQGIAERYDIVVDFSTFRIGDKVHLVDILHADQRQQAGRHAVADAMRSRATRTIRCSAPIMRVPHRRARWRAWTFRARSCVRPIRTSAWFRPCSPSRSRSSQPVRTRVVEFGRGNGDSLLDPATPAQCIAGLLRKS